MQKVVKTNAIQKKVRKKWKKKEIPTPPKLRKFKDFKKN